MSENQSQHLARALFQGAVESARSVAVQREIDDFNRAIAAQSKGEHRHRLAVAAVVDDGQGEERLVLGDGRVFRSESAADSSEASQFRMRQASDADRRLRLAMLTARYPRVVRQARDVVFDLARELASGMARTRRGEKTHVPTREFDLLIELFTFLEGTKSLLHPCTPSPSISMELESLMRLESLDPFETAIFIDDKFVDPSVEGS